MPEDPYDKLIRWKQDPRQFVREVFEATPDDWQDDVLEAFPHHQKVALRACKNPGKAQPVDTMIETPGGLRRFGDLAPGDEVFGGNGKPTRVVSVHPQGALPVYRVTFDDDSSTFASGEHLWAVMGDTERRAASGPHWVVLTTEQILDRGVRNKNGRFAGRHFEIPTQGAVHYPDAELPLDPYLLGVWLGDGVRGRGIYATKPTDEIGDEIRRRGYQVSASHAGIVSVCGLMAPLRQLGVLDNYSYEKSVPSVFLRASVEQRRDLLCGLMDTDGEIADDGHMQFSSTSQALLHDVQWLVRSLGGVAYEGKPRQPFYYDKDRQKVPGRTGYRLTINLPFNPFLVPHRRERWKDPARGGGLASRWMKRKLDRIEAAGEAECVCIKVEAEDGLYLTNDFIVTHNTCVMAWLAWNFLATRPHPKIIATSVTADNLADGLWTEMAKWYQRSAFLKAMFDWGKTAITSKQNPETWWMVARTWPKNASSEQQADTLAGRHADYIMFVIDESGGIPPGVLVAAEAALGSCIEGHILQGGNTTDPNGMLYEATITNRKSWYVVSITGDPEDPKRSPRVDKAWAQDLIDRHGRDHPYVMVNVLGQFPPSSFNTLLSMDDIRIAQQRHYREDDIAKHPRILGVDVALYGGDASVIFPRQGLVAFNPEIFRNIEPHVGAGRVAAKWQDWDADTVFVDDTGGYGASWISHLRLMGRAPIGVGFAQSPNDEQFANKRAEMYFLASTWIKQGGQLPPANVHGMAELAAAMTQTTYTAKRDKLILEPKELVADRIGYSPDSADALVLSFAHPVAPRSRAAAGVARHQVDWDYAAAMDQMSQQGGAARKHQVEFDPFA